MRNLQLKSAVEKAKLELSADNLPTLEAAKNRLTKAIVRAESYIAIGTSNGNKWAKFLRLATIKAELEKELPDVDKIAELERNLAQNYPGLESSALAELRSALGETKRALRHGMTTDRTMRNLNGYVDRLLASLDSEEASQDRFKLSRDVGRVVNFLYECEQTPEAISEMRAYFGQPNLQVFARERFVNRLLSDPVAKPSPVNECILGTRVIGNACLQGNLMADLMPMPNGVSIQLSLNGTLTSDNRGFNRGVVLGTTSSSTVSLSKLLYASLDSLSSSPAIVCTDTSTQINSISHKLRIVRKIARKKVAQQKPQADAIAERRMQNKLRRQYDDQVEEQLQIARAKLQETKSNPRPEFVRFEIPRPLVGANSSHDAVHGNVVQAAAYQLAAEESCKLPKPLGADVVIELHQSMAINVLDSFLADRTIKEYQIPDLAKQLLGKVPENLEPNPEPFVATMTPFNPIDVAFDEGQVALKLLFRRLDGKDNQVEYARVKVAYMPVLKAGNLTLKRQGEISVELPTVRSAIERTSKQSGAKAKMEPIFKEEIVLGKLDLKKFLPNAPNMELSHIQIDDGWMQIGAR
ncbi:MAG: hypothetical protein AAF483_14025 [Planctomycetota bacterium]